LLAISTFPVKSPLKFVFLFAVTACHLAVFNQIAFYFYFYQCSPSFQSIHLSRWRCINNKKNEKNFNGSIQVHVENNSKKTFKAAYRFLYKTIK
jgi:hypothetical protein